MYFLNACFFQISVRDSKFGTALVIASSESSGGFVLGFKLDPEEKLKNLYKELTSLHTIYTSKPIFGVEYNWNSKETPEYNNTIIDDLDLVEDSKGEISNSMLAYLADEGHTEDRPPVYCPELGLAIESLKPGYTLQQLWEVIPSE